MQWFCITSEFDSFDSLGIFGYKNTPIPFFKIVENCMKNSANIYIHCAKKYFKNSCQKFCLLKSTKAKVCQKSVPKTRRCEYFRLGCDKNHGIVYKFDQISEKFLCLKTKISDSSTIFFGFIVHFIN